MLLAVGGLMASLVLPGREVPTLALTAAAALARLAKHNLSPAARERRRNRARATEDGSTSEPAEDVILEWRDVTCVLDGGGDAKGRKILDRVFGTARPGRICAIMGPSGSGKTTLLNALAGRLPASSRLSLSGTVSVNGVSIDEIPHAPAYLTQEDLFFSQLTVQETLEMAAQMRLPRDMPKEEKDKFVDSLARKLGLLEVMGSVVGDEKTRGISGGEKKRLSLGCELISAPRLILCDEPTTGLDAFQAEQVMSSLRALAEAGHTVICSIHQPSSSIFQLCNDIVLLAGGRVAYSGSAKEAPAYFGKLGFSLPEQCNPAEQYLKWISVDSTSDETIAESEAKINKLIEAARSDHKSSTNPNASGDANGDVKGVIEQGSNLGPVGQIRLLLQRAWRQVTRDKSTNMSRLTTSVMSALLFGAIYWRIGRTQSSIQDRLGLLQVCTINSAMSTLVKTLNVFPRESVLVNRERGRGSYNVPQYFISKLVAELPVSAFFPLIFSVTVYPMVRLSGGLGRILRFLGIITLESFTAASYGLAVGALMPSTESALAVGPASFILQIVFGGLYITDESVPKWASWIPRVSLIKHAYEALCVNELRGLQFETKRPWDVKSGEQVLQRMGWGDSTVRKACLSQLRVLAFNYLATYTILTLKKPRFEKLQPSAGEAVVNAVLDKDTPAEAARKDGANQENAEKEMEKNPALAS